MCELVRAYELRSVWFPKMDLILHSTNLSIWRVYYHADCNGKKTTTRNGAHTNGDSFSHFIVHTRIYLVYVPFVRTSNHTSHGIQIYQHDSINIFFGVRENSQIPFMNFHESHSYPVQVNSWIPWLCCKVHIRLNDAFWGTWNSKKFLRFYLLVWIFISRCPIFLSFNFI